MPRIITDIDGTILQGGKPVERVIAYIKAESEEVVILTNRPESERDKTVDDLKATGLSYEKLIMNDTGESAPVFKKAKVKEYLDKGERVDEFIDNDADNRAAVASLGVKVLNPADIKGTDDEDETEDESMSRKTRIRKQSKLTTKGKQMKPETLETLNAALTAKAETLSVEIATTKQALADSEALLSAAKVELAGFEAFKTAAAADKEKLTKALAEATEKLAKLETDNKGVEAKAAAIVAACSADPAAVSPAPEGVAGPSGDILAKYNSLTGAERIEFFKQNKQAIWKASAGL